jgi:hypothetical protein
MAYIAHTGRSSEVRGTARAPKVAPQSSCRPTMVLMTLIVGSVMVNGEAWNK